MEMSDEILFRGNPDIVYPKAAGRGISFKCFKCPSIFDRKESLLTHASLHGANKAYKCTTCDYTVNSEQLLSKHLMKHRESESVKMVGVSKPRSSQARHSYEEVTLPAVEDEPTEEVKSHDCTECPATFPARKELMVHMHNHGNLHPNRCQFCSFSTRRRDYLQKHLLLHDTPPSKPAEEPKPAHGDSDFKCLECPAVFGWMSELNRHTARHGSHHRFKCTICNYAVGRKDALDTHIAVHESKHVSPHQKRPEKKTFPLPEQSSPESYQHRFQCDKCPYKATSRAQKRKHQLLHQDEAVVESTNMAANTLQQTSAAKRRRSSEETADGGSSKRPKSFLTAEDYQQLRRGNPSIKYAPMTRRSGNGRKVRINTYKCFKCPYQTTEYKGYETHQSKHGGIPRKNQCPYCDFSIDEVLPKSHLRLHEASEQRAKKTSSDSITKKVLEFQQKPSANGNPGTESHPDKIFSFTEAYSTEPFDKPQWDFSKHLVERVQVSDFMGLETFDVPITNILSFQGMGKSASIAALLLGLGYDMLLEGYSPSSLCGLPVDGFVRDGADECSVETLISLHSSPKLQREFGTHLKLQRVLQRGLPLPSSYLRVCSADRGQRFPTDWKIIEKKRLRKILKNLNIQPEISRIILLDHLNLEYVLQSTESWYEYYDATCRWTSEKISARLKILMQKYNRLLGEIQWRMKKSEFLSSQLESSESCWSSYDEAEKEKLENELQEFYERREVLDFGVNSYTNELNKLRKTMTGRLKFRYQEFLHRQNYVGSILVDDEKKSVGIWIAEAKFFGTHPQTVQEAMVLWPSTPPSHQRLAAIGLFFALIDISHSPIFFIDAYSSRPEQFSIPPESQPLLAELIDKKCSQGHQFVTCLPDGIKK